MSVSATPSNQDQPLCLGLAERYSKFLAWPSSCRVCLNWPTDVICQSCLTRFIATRHRCQRCAKPLHSTASHSGPVECGTCLQHPPPLTRCVAAVDYAYPWDRLIGALKFRDDPVLALQLGRLLANNETAIRLARSCDAVLPIPLSTERLKERGYSQAQLIAQSLAPSKTLIRLLLRIRHTRPQSECSLTERLSNVRNAFVIDPSQQAFLKGKKLLLVDDVMTTGTSLFEAAQTLLQAGADQVSAVVIARTHHD
jgi:ComF family protein